VLGEGCPDPYGVLGEVFMPNAVRMRSLLKSMAPTVPFYLTQSLVLHQMQRTVESVTFVFQLNTQHTHEFCTVWNSAR